MLPQKNYNEEEKDYTNRSVLTMSSSCLKCMTTDVGAPTISKILCTHASFAISNPFVSHGRKFVKGNERERGMAGECFMTSDGESGSCSMLQRC